VIAFVQNKRGSGKSVQAKNEQSGKKEDKFSHKQYRDEFEFGF
jgi:hypothetical protein